MRQIDEQRITAMAPNANAVNNARKISRGNGFIKWERSGGLIHITRASVRQRQFSVHRVRGLYRWVGTPVPVQLPQPPVSLQARAGAPYGNDPGPPVGIV